MAYIGRQLARGENKLFDDISSGFNGSTTTFTLAVSSVATATATPYQLFVSLGGVMQKPNTDFTTAGNQITFTTAPAAGLSCWIMMQGDTIDQAAIPDASVTPSKIAGSGDFAFPADVRLKDGDGSHYVGFQAPTTVSTNKIWTLPAADGSANQYLKTDGSGTLSWGSDSTSDPSKMPLAGGTFTGDVTFSGDANNVVWDKSDNALEFADNAKAVFGTGSDLKIFHDTNHSYLQDSGTGNLNIDSSSVLIRNAGGTENIAKFIADGQVELYFDNSKKFETTAAGCRVASGNLYILDNSEINIGNGNDLKLYHDGTNSYLKNLTGHLYIHNDATSAGTVHLTNSFLVHNEANTEVLLSATNNGSVDLYYDNSKKIETTSSGVTVSGTVQVGSNSAPSLLESSTGGGGSEDIFRVGLNRTNASTSDRQIWSEYTVSSSLAKFAIYARPANDTGTAGLKFSVDAVAGTVSDSKGDLRNIPRNNQTSQYTLVVGDAGKVVGVTSGGWIIPANVFTTVGQVVTLLNRSTSDQTVNASALTYLWNTADGANIKASTLTLGAQSMATIWFEGGDTGYIQASNLTVS